MSGSGDERLTRADLELIEAAVAYGDYRRKHPGVAPPHGIVKRLKLAAIAVSEALETTRDPQLPGAAV